MTNEITIYTDGSSLGNPGPGGWGALLFSSKRVIELGGREEATTNNRMELLSLIRAFEELIRLGVRDYHITVHADSKYVLDGLTKWLPGWKARGWKKADKKPVLNQDLWQQLDDLHHFIEVDNKLFFEHVKGHSGEIFNERVDEIACGFAEEASIELFEGERTQYIA